MILVLLVVALLPCFVWGEEVASDVKPAWTARKVPAGVVETIINGNMFTPDLRREPKVEEPDDGDEAEEVEVEEAQDAPPEPEVVDPDRGYRLVGTSHAEAGWFAFIESRVSGEIYRVSVDESVASGRVTMIDYNRIEYEVEKDVRTILIGQDLTGAAPQASIESELSRLFDPEGSDSGSSSGSDRELSDETANPGAEPSDAENQRAEILRRLRERRERESQ